MRKWVTVEIEVCEFCSQEDCYGECQRIEAKSPPDRVEHVQKYDPYTGITWDYDYEWRGQELTVVGPCIRFEVMGLPYEPRTLAE